LPTIAPAREALLSEARQARLAGHAAAGPSAGTHDQSGVHEAPPAALPPDDPPPEPAASAPPARLLRPALPGAVAGADRPARLALPPRPLIDEAARAQARREAEDLRAELAARRPPAPVATTPPPPPATVAAAAVPAPPGVERAARAAPAVVLLPAAAPDAAAPPAGTVWALTTRPLRTAAEAEQFIAAMRTLLAPMAALPAAPGTPTALQVERLPAGDDWRVVCWPFPRRADAERAAAVLAARGLRTQPVDF
jgi:hypothetical protein